MGVLIRDAGPTDSRFLGLAMQEADRGHTGIGSWDVVFPGPDAEGLELLAGLSTAAARSYVHWSTFLVVAADSTPVGTVARYVRAAVASERLKEACREVLVPRGWSDERIADTQLGARSGDFFRVELPADEPRLEWVFTDPEHRGRGVSTMLIKQVLERARGCGLRSAFVGTYIGNEPAIGTYERSGFVAFAECRHVDYEAQFGSPGLVFLRRSL